MSVKIVKKLALKSEGETAVQLFRLSALAQMQKVNKSCSRDVVFAVVLSDHGEYTELRCELRF